jgi:hypothetical protein
MNPEGIRQHAQQEASRSPILSSTNLRTNPTAQERKITRLGVMGLREIEMAQVAE